MDKTLDQMELFKQSEMYQGNVALVDNVVAEKANRTLVYENVMQPNTGDAFLVKAGQVIRLEQRDTVVQVNDWILISPDLSEWSLLGNCAGLQGFNISKYYHVMSNTRSMKPMALMVADEAPDDFAPEGWNRHFWFYHCSPEWNENWYPGIPEGDNSCHVDFVHGINRIPAIHAIEDEQERKDKVNMLACMHGFQTFQLLGWNTAVDGHNTTVSLAPSPDIHVGTGVEFYACMDLYAVITMCPHGNIGGPGSGPRWDNEKKKHADLRPVHISVWETGIKPNDPPTWRDWEGYFYDQVAKGEKDISPRTSAESYK